MRLRLLQVVAGVSGALCLAVTMAFGQSVRVIKLVPTEPLGPLELTTAEEVVRPKTLPPPIPPLPEPAYTGVGIATTLPMPATPSRPQVSQPQQPLDWPPPTPPHVPHLLPQGPQYTPAAPVSRPTHPTPGSTANLYPPLPEPMQPTFPVPTVTPPRQQPTSPVPTVTPPRQQPTMLPSAPLPSPLPSAPVATPAVPHPPTDSRLVPVATPAQPCNSCEQQNPLFWLSAEALLWWMNGQATPALAITSFPNATLAIGGTGLISAPNSLVGATTVLGDQRLNGGIRSGARFTAGWWFGSEQSTGLVADYFFLGSESKTLQVVADGIYPLSRPFTDVNTGLVTSEIVGLPGRFIDGRITARANSSTIEGTGALLRQRLLLGVDPQRQPVYRLDGLVGYRFLTLGESLMVSADSLSVLPNGNIDSFVWTTDEFQTRNTFHGFDCGLLNRFGRGPFTVDVLTKLAVGSMEQRVTIQGSRKTLGLDGTYSLRSGGLLAQATNSGVHKRSETALIPELGVTLNWQMNSFLRLYTGYSLLYVSNVVRPGDQIDSTVDPIQLGGGAALDGVTRPAFAFNTSELWLQGVKVGLELSY